MAQYLTRSKCQATLTELFRDAYMFLIHYKHIDCAVQPGITWQDLWSCACNGECPACGVSDIEPVSYEEVLGE